MEIKKMQQAKIKEMLKKYSKVFKMLENYDKTRELPFQRKRIDITLPVSTINMLKNASKKTKKPISRIIEESLQGMKKNNKIQKSF